MKKDIEKTCILVGIVLAIITIIFFIVGNVKYGAQLLTRNSLVENDPTVVVLLDRMSNLKELRQASVINTELQNEEIIKYVLDNLTESDYEIKKVKPKKIVCEVNNTIAFNAINGKCEIIVISNSKFAEYEKKLLGIDITLEYSDINYSGYSCKNDGTNYYCQLVNDNKKDSLGYSLFKDAYSEKDKVVIREYYLNIDVSNKEKCLKYFENEYCDNYNTKEKPELSKEIIVKDGVLYEHVFKDNGNNYYLEKSFIVSER